jgi:CDP-diacylglycerol--serine O-phosphatidyltransferase
VGTRFDLQRAMFVLPNLFTISSIFCGLYAIVLCTEDPSPRQLYRAALSVFFAMFFDMFDGRVARLTRTQSEFGVQLDSLADLVSFGVAPALLLYRWALVDLGLAGLFIAFLYVACGAMRLARFNVIAARDTGSIKYFLGLPIPLAAGTIVALVLVNFPFERPAPGGGRGVAAVAIVLALLMVSNVHYRTFKDLRPSRKSITLLFVLGLLLAILSARVKPSFALAALFVGYLGAGLLEEVLFFRLRRAQLGPDDEDFEVPVAEDDEDEDPRPART